MKMDNKRIKRNQRNKKIQNLNLNLNQREKIKRRQNLNKNLNANSNDSQIYSKNTYSIINLTISCFN